MQWYKCIRFSNHKCLVWCDTIRHNPKYGVRNLREPKIVALRQTLKIAKK